MAADRKTKSHAIAAVEAAAPARTRATAPEMHDLGRQIILAARKGAPAPETAAILRDATGSPERSRALVAGILSGAAEGEDQAAAKRLMEIVASILWGAAR